MKYYKLSFRRYIFSSIVIGAIIGIYEPRLSEMLIWAVFDH